MGRKRKIEINQLIDLIDKYHFENPEIKVKIPAIGRYVRKNGFDIDDYLIRRYKIVTKHIDDINAQCEETFTSVVISYKPTDPEQFFYNNKSKEKVVNSITELNSYYSYICSAAIHFKKEKENISQINEILKKENQKLKSDNEKLCFYKDNLKKKDMIIKKLKDIIFSDVYPEKAASILKEKGVFEIENSIIDDSLSNNIIDSKTNMQKYANDTLNDLLSDLDK